MGEWKMAKTKTIMLYTFDELSEDAKQVAREWWMELGLDEWWDGTYEDAKNVGLKITSFDIDRGNCIEGDFTEDACYTAHKIVDEHGDTCETFKTAEDFLKERDGIVDSAPKDENGDFTDVYELDQKLDECEAEFLKSILEDYLINLRHEYEYQTSNESIDENILCNEYTFRENGQREN